MKKGFKALKVIVFTLILALAALLVLDMTGVFSLDGNKNHVSYKAFSEDLNQGKVQSVTIEKNSLSFVTDKGSFKTDNPQSAELKRQLLEMGINVKTSSDADINAILDIVFDIVFFGAIAFGLYKLLDYSKKTFRVVHNTGVHFDDIAGMDDVKKDMMFLVQVLNNPKEAQKRGIRPVKGVILEGPPGNGKTLFAKALAQEANVNFIATKGADFQSALMSMGARKIKMMFSKASKKKPCILFIDEFDSIGERRNYAGSGIDKENNRIITTMLNEMDGFSANNGILVIAATNSYASLDPALVRPGRFDLKYTISNPDAKTREKLVELYTKDKNLSEDLTAQVLSVTFDGLSCSAIETVLNQAQAICQGRGESTITIAHLLEAGKKTDSKLNIRIKNK